MGENQDYKVERIRYYFTDGRPFDVLYVRCQHCRDWLALDMTLLNLVPGFWRAVGFLLQHSKCQKVIQQRIKEYIKPGPEDWRGRYTPVKHCLLCPNHREPGELYCSWHRLDRLGNRFPDELPPLPSYESSKVGRQEASGDADIPAPV